MVLHISKAFPLIALYGGSQSSNGQSVLSSGSGNTSTVIRGPETIEHSGRGDMPPKKKEGTTIKVSPKRLSTVWLQTGQDSYLARSHISSPMEIMQWTCQRMYHISNITRNKNIQAHVLRVG